MIRSYLDQIKKLRFLIKKVSDYYGGDDEKFLEEYCGEIISINKDNLDKILECFLDLEKNIND